MCALGVINKKKRKRDVILFLLLIDDCGLLWNYLNKVPITIFHQD